MFPEVGVLNDGILVLSNPKEAEVKLIKSIIPMTIRKNFSTMLFPHFFIKNSNVYLFI